MSNKRMYHKTSAVKSLPANTRRPKKVVEIAALLASEFIMLAVLRLVIVAALRLLA